MSGGWFWLTLVPVLLGWSRGMAHAEHMERMEHMAHMGHAGHLAAAAATMNGPLPLLAAVGVHTTGHLLVALFIALLIYERLGLAILKRAWFNLDLLWVIALMISGVLILIMLPQCLPGPFSVPAIE